MAGRFEDGRFVCPDIEALKKYRLIVTTLQTARTLRLKGFRRDNFTHIFLDEAAQVKWTKTALESSMQHTSFYRRTVCVCLAIMYMRMYVYICHHIVHTIYINNVRTLFWGRCMTTMSDWYVTTSTDRPYVHLYINIRTSSSPDISCW